MMTWLHLGPRSRAVRSTVAAASLGVLALLVSACGSTVPIEAAGQPAAGEVAVGVDGQAVPLPGSADDGLALPLPPATDGEETTSGRLQSSGTRGTDVNADGAPDCATGGSRHEAPGAPPGGAASPQRSPQRPRSAAGAAEIEIGIYIAEKRRHDQRERRRRSAPTGRQPPAGPGCDR